MWGVSSGLISSLLPWMRAASLRLRLESHLHYIYTADWLVKLEGGLTNLQENDLKKVNYTNILISHSMCMCSDNWQVKWCSALVCVYMYVYMYTRMSIAHVV